MSTLLNYTACRQASAPVRRQVINAPWHPGMARAPSLLDIFTGAAAAYSIRQLSSTYTKCLTVRRSSDGLTKDIGFDNGVLNTTDLLDFVGAGDGFVTTVYDQTGNGNDLTQPSQPAQGKIVSSGALLTKNGKPAIDFTASQWMQSTIAGLSNATNLSNFAVISPNAEAAGDVTTFHMMSYAGGGADVSTRGGTVGSAQTGLLTGEKFGMYFSSATVSSGRLGSSSYYHLAGQQLIMSAFFLSSGSLAYQNGSAISFNLAAVMTTATPAAPANDDSATSTFRINSIDGVNGTAAEMFQESIVYLSNYTANRVGVETNMSDFYYGTADVKSKVGIFSSPTSTGSQTITGIGFQPKAVIPFGAGMTGDGATTTIIKSFGAITGNANASVSVRSQNAVTTSATARHHNATNAISYIDGTLAATNILASRQSLDANGFTLNYSAVDAVARISNHICLGGVDLEVSLTQHQLNGTNAPQSFAHGLSGVPTGIISFSIGIDNTPPATVPTMAYHLGLWANGQQYLTSILAMNGFLTTQTKRTLVNGRCLTAGLGSGGSYVRSLSIDSVDTSNVNCTYQDTADAGQRLFWMLAIRGAKCQAGTFHCNGSLSPLGISCMGITPKLFFGLATPECVDNINTVRDSINLSLWASDGTNHVSCGITDLNGMTTSNTRRHQYSTVLSEITASTGAQQFQATAKFVGQSVVITPTLITSSSFGQGGYLIIGA